MTRISPTRSSNRGRHPLDHRWLLAVALMGVIVGAACQPLQPADTSLPGEPVPVASGAALTNAVGGNRIALLVPLSGRQQALGQAVRDGFVAAWLASGERPDVAFYDDAGLGAIEAYRQAQADGATLIVGPLLRESLQTLAPVLGDIPVLALNALPEDVAAPPGLYQFSLSPEDEARAVATRALAEGQRRAIALVPDSDWGRRLMAAFTGELAAGGGTVVAQRFYPPGSVDFSRYIPPLLRAEEGVARAQRLEAILGQPVSFEPRRRTDIDLVFMPSSTEGGRQIRPQLRFFEAGDLPAYGTSAIWEDGSRNETDLEGVRFPDAPWIVYPDAQATALKNTLVRYQGRGALGLSRLYAMGSDAYALARRLSAGAMSSAEFDGLTGALSIDADGRVRRRLAWAEVRGGRLAPLPAPEGESAEPASVVVPVSSAPPP